MESLTLLLDLRKAEIINNVPEPTPSLLTIILDTNPYAWALLKDTLPLHKAIATLLVFINAHLACNYTNQVAVLASHVNRAQWLYPSHTPNEEYLQKKSTAWGGKTSQDTIMTDNDGTSNLVAAQTSQKLKLKFKTGAPKAPSSNPSDANKYRPFRLVEEEITRNLTSLVSSTTPDDLSNSTSTMIGGALTLALSYINRETIAYNETHGSSNPLGTTSNDPSSTRHHPNDQTGLQSRILLLSVSANTTLAHQYIPIMNTIFACQRLQIPIDICRIAGSTVFLQQASDATRGIYMSLTPPSAPSLLQHLMMAFLPDQRSRRHLILPTRVDVDFRPACFCHRKVVDVGFVCSICLSIFCSVPEGADCLTCGTHLQLGDYGGKPAVIARKKKRKRDKNKVNGGTPTPGPS